jgi:hypothetical protein
MKRRNHTLLLFKHQAHREENTRCIIGKKLKDEMREVKGLKGAALWRSLKDTIPLYSFLIKRDYITLDEAER